MTKISFVEHDGTRHEVEADTGSTIMEAALRNNVPGIVAECGGACTCATCHCYIDDKWVEAVGGPSAMEEDMLDFAYDVKESSRLSCQVKISEPLEGLIVHIPERQG